MSKFISKKVDKVWLRSSLILSSVHSASNENTSGLCQSESSFTTVSSNQSCSQQESPSQQGIYPLLLSAQLLLGVAAVPIQPFGISYIDDFASRENSPLYLGTAYLWPSEVTENLQLPVIFHSVSAEVLIFLLSFLKILNRNKIPAGKLLKNSSLSSDVWGGIFNLLCVFFFTSYWSISEY